ncbi:hypothetical protein CPB86DRAFT_798158 [Serendipita vermifera]|nr:hypothetical protein CPB86DRAFT_798158 [Serendipita vermifera]
MFYHPAFRNLLISIAITAVLLAFSRDTATVATMVVVLIINVAGLLLFHKGYKFSVVSSQGLDSKRNGLGFKELSPGQDPVVEWRKVMDSGKRHNVVEGLATPRHSERENLDLWIRLLYASFHLNIDSKHFTTHRNLCSRIDPAHSLGDIILKKALVLCHSASYNSDSRFITVSTYAILFFGTPQSGANSVDLAQWMGRLLSVYMFTEDTILKDLSRDSIELQSIQKFYLGASERIKSIFFYEVLPTSLMKGVAELIVPRGLAIIDGDRNAKVVGLHSDHCEIVKYQERDNNEYRKVVGHLSNLVGEAPVRVKQVHISYAEIFANVYRSTGRWNDNLELWDEEFGEQDERAIRMKAKLGTALWECARGPGTCERDARISTPDTSIIMHNLATTLRDRGQLGEAEKMEREVLELEKDILGPRHPSTVTTMHNLAFTLRLRGQLSEAEKMEREVRKEILGPRHPDMINTMNNLAYTLRDRGQIEEAEAVWREALVLRKEVLGQQHPHTLNTMKALAQLLHKCGQLEEAQSIEQDIEALQKD